MITILVKHLCNAVLDLMEDGTILKNAQENAIYFNNMIKEKFLSHKNVGEVRHIGLINAIELVEDKKSKKPFDGRFRTGYQIYKKALMEGVILRPLGDVIYFNPPLIMSRKDMDLVTDIARKCLDEILPTAK